MPPDQRPSDERIATAIAHWGPRFVANGVPLSDFQEVTAGLQRWEHWCSAWSARAAQHEALGRQALAEGRRLSAGQHLTTAAVCYHFGKFVLVDRPAEMRAAHRKAVECRALALPHLRPPGERVEIPYPGGPLIGILRRPADAMRPPVPMPGVAGRATAPMPESAGRPPVPMPESAGRPPVLILAMGLDSAKEEMDAYESTFLARGLATLTFDGPGQGEAEYDLPIRGDYEVPVRAVLDWVGTRPELDAQRIGLWGVSLGGYYAPRAAAFEPRIRACIALAGPYDWGEIWDGLPGLTREAFRVRSHLATQAEARRHAATLSLAGIAGRIACPLFIVTGKRDRIIPWQQAERLARDAAGPVEFLAIEDGNHVANNRAHLYRMRSADWMARQLGVAAS